MRSGFMLRDSIGMIIASVALSGCGTTKMTDSPRAATEMLLTSQAIDYAVGQLDFCPLAEQTVYLDTSQLGNDLVDRGYLISSIRQQLLAHGALLQEERANAVFVVELRVGALGTDRHSMMIGTPAITLPSVVPGIPTNIPEIALVKKSDQRGVAKIAVFAYNRLTGRAVWQSGTVESSSQIKDTWVFGAGPFTRGTIRKRPELAGEPLPDITDPAELFGHKDKPMTHLPTAEQSFPNHDLPPPPKPLPNSIQALGGTAIVIDRVLLR